MLVHQLGKTKWNPGTKETPGTDTAEQLCFLQLYVFNWLKCCWPRKRTTWHWPMCNSFQTFRKAVRHPTGIQICLCFLWEGAGMPKDQGREQEILIFDARGPSVLGTSSTWLKSLGRKGPSWLLSCKSSRLLCLCTWGGNLNYHCDRMSKCPVHFLGGKSRMWQTGHCCCWQWDCSPLPCSACGRQAPVFETSPAFWNQM